MQELVDQVAQDIDRRERALRDVRILANRKATQRTWRREVVLAGETRELCTICGHSFKAGDEIASTRNRKRSVHGECLEELADMVNVRSQFDGVVAEIREDEELFSV